MESATFRQLQVLASVVELGSLTAAAERLGISQPAVSAHLRSLERQIGRVLIEHRPGRTASATEAGLATYRHAVQILDHFDRMMREVGTGKGRMAKRLVLITSRYATRFWLRDAIETFMDNFPDAIFDVQAHGFQNMAERIRDGRADLAYFFSFGQKPALKTNIIHHEPRSLFVSSDHPLAGKPRPEPEDIARYPFIIPPPDSYFGSSNIAALESVGITGFRILFETFERELRASLASEGKGVVYLFDRVIEADVRAGKLVRVDIDLPPFEFHEAARTFLTPHNLVESFRELVRRNFATQFGARAPDSAPPDRYDRA